MERGLRQVGDARQRLARLRAGFEGIGHRRRGPGWDHALEPLPGEGAMIADHGATLGPLD
ncbi:MAG: hypothetical protein IRY87_24075 [Acetobacteraceae bacterium]|nr:hypothetical protein [Acetobacteraceae bacterium]